MHVDIAITRQVFPMLQTIDVPLGPSPEFYWPRVVQMLPQNENHALLLFNDWVVRYFDVMSFTKKGHGTWKESEADTGAVKVI